MKKTSLFTSLFVILILSAVPIVFFREGSDSYFLIAIYVMLMFMCAFMLQYRIERNCEQDDALVESERVKALEEETKKQLEKAKKEFEEYKNEHKRVERFLKYNLNDKEVWLIDYENCPYIPANLKNKGSDTYCYIFTNLANHDRIKSQIRLIDTNAIFETIVTPRTGKNLADIEIATYVGMICSLYLPTSVKILSRDKGYGVVLDAVENIGIKNVSVINYSQEKPLDAKQCEHCYMLIKKNTLDKTLSMGSFKRKLKKTRLGITSDEMKCLIDYLLENKRIEIIKTSEGEVVKLK